MNRFIPCIAMLVHATLVHTMLVHATLVHATLVHTTPMKRASEESRITSALGRRKEDSFWRLVNEPRKVRLEVIAD